MPQFKIFNSSFLTILYAPTVTSIHDNWKIALIILNFFLQSNVFAFKNVVRLVITLLQTSKHLLISWLQSSSAVILELLKIKSLTVTIVSPSICHEVMGWNAMIFIFLMLNLSQMFHSPLSLSPRGSLVSLHILPWEWSLLHIWGYWYFSQQLCFQPVLHPVGHFAWWTQNII